MKKLKINPVLLSRIFCILLFSCQEKITFYTVDDFEEVPKIDAHFHYLTTDRRYMDFAISQKFRIVSPNVDSGLPLDKQLEIASQVRKNYPGHFYFLGTFPVINFLDSNFTNSTIETIRNSFYQGANGIKIWKNIGMVITDENGNYIMVDDPVFEPVFKYLEENKIPLLAHLGEPKDCWLPLNKMINPSNRAYYSSHPQYHMFLHPDAPSYEQQIAARDNLLKNHPDLIFVGAHLGSLEWSIDELTTHFDAYPNFNVDMSARIWYLKNQAQMDREKVRDFVIEYQDRILYGTDYEVHDTVSENVTRITESIRKGWMTDWIFLATDSINGVKGLRLPKNVIDKIYYKNAERLYDLR